MKKFRPRVRSRHDTHEPLRSQLPLLPVRSVIRLGSTHSYGDEVSVGGRRIELNTVEAIKTSANKYLMKVAFAAAEVRTPLWWTISTFPAQPGVISIHKEGNDHDNPAVDINELPYPIVAKHIFGSRGSGNYLLNTPAEFTNWLKGKTLSNYIFEKFYSYNREYRLHVSELGCFYTCRKVIKNDTAADKRWFRNDQNSNWIKEDNLLFDKPVNWAEIEAECVKALKAVGLDFGAFDVRVQSTKKDDGKVRKAPKFIIIESNSAPSFGEVTLQRYLETLPILLNNKIKNDTNHS